MDIEPALRQVELQEETPLPFPRAWWGRALYGLFVGVMPILAFWGTELFLPEWQNGSLDSYLILLLSPKASRFFYPLIAYSALSYLLLLGNSARYAQRFIVRLGIYVGVLLALHFTIVSGLFFYKESSFSFVLVVIWLLLPLLVSKIYPWAMAKWGRRPALLSTVVFVSLLFVALMILSSQILTPFMLLLAGLTIASPFWCLLLFGIAAFRLLKNYETAITLPRGLELTAWLGAYAIAWRFSILKMYELYNALPHQPPPDCYIATAATHGHAQFVGSRIIQRADGTSIRLNKQLQILKCAELALMAVVPKLHGVLRRIYDVLGTALARRIQSPPVADIAYLLLKPFERMAWIVLQFLIPEIEKISNGMYIKES